jgi:hypothetical protein
VGCPENARKRDEIISITVWGDPALQESSMNLNLSIAPLVALLAGILILVMPRLLNYIVALYLIIIGVLGLMGGGGSFHLH